MTPDAWLDKLTDMGQDADVACWSVTPMLWSTFHTRRGCGLGGTPHGQGYGSGYDVWPRATPWGGDGYGGLGNGIGDGLSGWRKDMLERLIESVLGEPDRDGGQNRLFS